jgi:hypothetical protein
MTPGESYPRVSASLALLERAWFLGFQEFAVVIFLKAFFI